MKECNICRHFINWRENEIKSDCFGECNIKYDIDGLREVVNDSDFCTLFKPPSSDGRKDGEMNPPTREDRLGDTIKTIAKMRREKQIQLRDTHSKELARIQAEQTEETK